MDRQYSLSPNAFAVWSGAANRGAVYKFVAMAELNHPSCLALTLKITDYKL